MFHNQLIQDRFGRRYKLHLLSDGPIPKHLEPKSFSDETVTRNFLYNLDVSESYWRQLSHQLLVSSSNTASSRDYLNTTLNTIARLLVQGRINIFDISESDTKQLPIEKRVFKRPDGRMYQFITPTDQLLNPTQQSKTFNSKEEAIEFVKELSPEEESIRDIARAFNLSSLLNVPNKDQEVLYASIADVIFDERVLVVSEGLGKPSVQETEYKDVHIKRASFRPESALTDEGPVRIDSIAFLDGADNRELTKKGKQFVNLPREDKWVDGTHVLNRDRLTNTPRFKVQFNQSGEHTFTVKLKPASSNIDFSDNEKGRNNNYTYFENERAYTTNTDGTLIIEDDLFITVAGKDKYQLVAEDIRGNKVKTKKIEVYRIIYCQRLPMETLSNVAGSISKTIREFKKHNIVLKDIGNAEVPHMPNIGSDDDIQRFKGNARTAYMNSSAPDKAPYVLAIAYTDQLAVKNPAKPMKSKKVDVGPGKPEVTIPIAAPGLTTGKTEKRALWQEIVPGEGWFVSASYLPAGGTAPRDSITIPEANCAAIKDRRFDNKHHCTDVKVTVTNLPPGTGIITLTVNLVDRMRGGLASSDNLAIVATRAWWKKKSTASQNRIIIHEFGHIIGMVPTENENATGYTGPDTTGYYYSNRGHRGPHCHKGLRLRTTFATGDNSAAACVMFGEATNKSAFCNSCKPAVKKVDLSNGWNNF